MKTTFDEWLEFNPKFNKLHILLDNGDTFDSFLAQFRDNFFDNACQEDILDWAGVMDFKCTLTLNNEA